MCYNEWCASSREDNGFLVPRNILYGTGRYLSDNRGSFAYFLWEYLPEKYTLIAQDLKVEITPH